MNKFRPYTLILHAEITHLNAGSLISNEHARSEPDRIPNFRQTKEKWMSGIPYTCASEWTGVYKRKGIKNGNLHFWHMNGLFVIRTLAISRFSRYG
jgi:hypothetical protein